MAILDNLNNVLSAIAGSLITLAGGWITLRKKLSSDATERVENESKAGWLRSLTADRDRAVLRAEEMEKERVDFIRQVAVLEARNKYLAEEVEEFKTERDKKYGECNERVRQLSESALDLRFMNGLLFMELTSIDKPRAERLLEQHNLRNKPSYVGPIDPNTNTPQAI
jgi:glycerol-3-phosphate dehydrogenase